MDNCQLLTVNSQLKKGYKQTEVGMIPSDWVILPIAELTPKNKQYTIVDGPFGSNLKTIHYRKSGIPIITSGYVTDGKFFASEYLYVDLEKFKQERRSAVKGGDIVMAKIGERCGASAILPKEHPEGILSGNSLKITIDENRFSTELIAQILWRHHTIRNFEILRTTGAQPAISMANLKKYKIPLPPTKAEQTGIATALSDADALISSLEKLITKKRNIKQGAMQQLLTGKKRLPGFEKKKDYKQTEVGIIPSDWDVKKLGSISSLIASGKSDTKPSNGIYPIYGSTGIIGLSNKYDYEGEKFLVARVGANAGTVNWVNGKYCVSDNTLMVQLKNDVCFLYAVFFLRLFNLNKLVFGSGQPLITGSQLKQLLIPIPSTKIEQTAIAQVLSDMDAEIEALEKKLVKYKMIKQGMMQELLTGKTRLA
ncbi:restriction endonuclease subunit S [Candidatus Brocadia pituitae]|nr:restriction endonuclease subunit S [Candidatus Brocadia pituitae]